MPAPSKYLPLFLAEAGEHCEALATELVRLEQEAPGGPLMDSIFRRMHSIKGSAATLGFSGVVALAHGAEELIGRLKAVGARPGRVEIDALLEATDALAKEVRRASASSAAGEATEVPEADAAVSSALVARLASAAAAHVVQANASPASQAVTVEPTPAALEAEPDGPKFDLVIALAKTCPAPGARAMIVQRKLKAAGTLLRMQPTPAQLLQTRGAARIVVRLATQRPLDEIRALCLSVPEVESVEEASTAAPAPAAVLSPAPAAASAPAGAPPARAGGVSASSDGEELRPDATVRVRAQTLDQLLDQAAELLQGIARLRERARRLPEAHASAMETDIDRLRRTARELHGRVVSARLTPFSALTERLPRAVRDLAHRLGKEVDLEVRGADVELDRTIIEAMGDPLSHLVRNAVDHGIEATDARLAAGKPARGKLVVTARRERDKVIVEIEDDGGGLDAAALRSKAVDLKLLDLARAQEMDDATAYELAFLPGLSTRGEATDVSGRGVGLDAVKGSIEALGGKLGLRSVRGKGVSFILELPLSVSMATLLLVQVGGELFGIPLHRVVLTTEYDLMARGGEGFESRSLVVMGQLVRAYILAKLFGLPSLAPPGPRPFVVLEVDGTRFALAVDRLVGQEEVILKPLYPPLDRVRGLAGTTLLGNGRPLLVLDPRGLAELSGARSMPPVTAPALARIQGAA